MRLSRLIFSLVLILLCLSAGSVAAQAPRRIQSITLDGRPLASFQYDKFKRLSRIYVNDVKDFCEEPFKLMIQVSYDRSGQLMSTGHFALFEKTTPYLFERRNYSLDIYNRVIEEKVERIDSTGTKMIPCRTHVFSYDSKEDVVPETERLQTGNGSLWEETISTYHNAGANVNVEVYDSSGKLKETQSVTFDPDHPMYHQSIPWVLRQWICMKCNTPPTTLQLTRYDQEEAIEQQESYRYLTEYDASGFPKRITVVNETNARQFVFEFEYMEE